MLTAQENKTYKQKIHEIKLQRELQSVNQKKLFWANTYHKNSRGKPMSFDKLSFQLGLYEALEKDRYVVCRKSVQNGISETFIVSHLEEANRGLAVLYVLPKTETRNTFVQNRINKTIKKVRFYQAKVRHAVGSTDNIILKGFGDGIIKYVDSNSESNFVEYPADALYIDEVDQCNQKNLAMAPDRLESSEYKLIRKVSNPSVEDYGIDIDYKAGTQNQWFIKCPHCNHWQSLDWFTHVVKEIDKRQYEILDIQYQLNDMENAQGEINLYCMKCNRPLDRMAPGIWVERFPGRDIKSFQISKLFSPFTSILDLTKRFSKALGDDTKYQLFYNSELGLPISMSGSKVTEDMLNSTKDKNYFMPDQCKEGFVYMGVDVGGVNNIIIRKWVNNKKLALYIGTHRDENEIIKLIELYSVKICVIDALPETRMVERVKEKCSKIYSCTFSQSTSIQVTKKDKKVSGKRTPFIDRVIEVFNKNIYVNPANIKDIPDYYRHMTSSTRVLDTDKTPPDYVWREVGPDHYFLAETYAEIACEIAKNSLVFSYVDDILPDEDELKKDRKKPITERITENDNVEEALRKIAESAMGFSGHGV